MGMIPAPILLTDGSLLGTAGGKLPPPKKEAPSNDPKFAYTDLSDEEDVQAVRELIAQDKVAFVQALLFLYELQTKDELRVGNTFHRNNLGFRNGAEGAFMTNLAKYYLKHKKLSEPQILAGRKTIRKYARQLIRTGWVEKYLEGK
jgi:hypothetical protein